MRTNAGENTSQGGEIENSLLELDGTLRDILDTILDETMAREIIYGAYAQKSERVDIREVVSSIRRRTAQRFPVDFSPDPFPCFVTDRQLLRYIYRNAISNACRYGKSGGVVETSVKCDNNGTRFLLSVSNIPAEEGHDDLLKLNPEETALFFAPRRTHSTINTVRDSGGAASIMQMCAEALGGNCDIRFDPTVTTFTFSCPIGYIDMGNFCLPKGTWGIAIDDSKIQLKILDRFFGAAGIEKSRRVILGKTPEEIFGFSATVKRLLAENPDDKFLVIVDENLDIIDGGTRHQTVSGSLCVEKILSELDTASEKRLLALVRSANDSSSDIETYKSRAHGFLLKEPMKREGVLHSIRPWWLSRFPSNSNFEVSSKREDSDTESQVALPEEILKAVNVLRALVTEQTDVVLERRWYIVRDKLHILKGDLKSTTDSDALLPVLIEIDKLVSSSRYPASFLKRWSQIERQIESLVKHVL